jgi:hypothetical protein
MRAEWLGRRTCKERGQQYIKNTVKTAVHYLKHTVFYLIHILKK